MKKILLINMFSIILIFSCSTKAQEIDFAPLQLGNSWVYQHYSGLLIRGEVIDTLLYIDSIKYFGLAEGYAGNDRALRLTEENYFVMKEDSSFPEPFNERKYYKKNAQVGDTWQVNYGSGGGGIATYTIIDSGPAYIFNTVVTANILRVDFGISDPWDHTWTEEFGLLSISNWWGETIIFLKGCVILGEVFGDTTFITGVNEFVSEISYNLYQNYPNPFNSATNIRYSIPQSNRVIIKVFDIMGKEVVTLLDRFQESGSSDVIFQAKDLASGIYFYEIRSNEFRDVKKLLLLK